MYKIDIAGLKIDAGNKTELLGAILKRIQNNQPTWVITAYSEFLLAALKDQKVMDMLNGGDFIVPDGIGIFWAYKFLRIPITAKHYLAKICQTFWQAAYSLMMILVYPKWAYNNLSAPSPIQLHSGRLEPSRKTDALGGISPQKERELQTVPTVSRDPDRSVGTGAVAPSPSEERAGERLQEKIPGSELIWDLARMAAENHLSIYLLGGFGDTPKIVAEKLLIPYTHGREFKESNFIAGFSSSNPNDPSVLDDINKSNANILFVAYGPIKQENWMSQNLGLMPSVKLAIGLGGSFDYIAGKRPIPPQFMRSMGLEWLWRLFTQPHRYKRIFNATFGLVTALVRYKVFNSFPLRPNVAVVVINAENKVLVCQRKQEIPHVDVIVGVDESKYRDYWQLPQGGIDEKENVVAAAKREAWEETGLKNLEFIKLSEKTYTYYWNNALRKFRFNKKFPFQGQIQHVAYFKFSGKDTEIKFDSTNEKEFINSQWVRIEDLDKVIHPERMGLTEIVKNDLTQYINI